MSGGSDQDGPAKKKARKNQQEQVRYHNDGSMVDNRGSAGSSDGGQSHRPRELTRTELEVIAALAMNANHERSLLHSANLDSDLLDHHAHPLHSVPASVSGDRFGSLVPPGAQPAAASEISFGSPRDRASNVSLNSDEEQIALHRQELARECEQARQTMSRLSAFLAKSEQMLAAMDEKLARAKSAGKSSETKEYAHSPLKKQSECSTLPQYVTFGLRCSFSYFGHAVGLNHSRRHIRTPEVGRNSSYFCAM